MPLNILMAIRGLFLILWTILPQYYTPSKVHGTKVSTLENEGIYPGYTMFPSLISAPSFPCQKWRFAQNCNLMGKSWSFNVNFQHLIALLWGWHWSLSKLELQSISIFVFYGDLSTINRVLCFHEYFIILLAFFEKERLFSVWSFRTTEIQKRSLHKVLKGRLESRQ